jgi:glycosyltransferase involved in cell wall biosynthesis
MYYLPFIVNMKKIKKIKSNFRILIIARFEERKKILFSLKVLNRLSKNYKFNLTVIGEVSKNIHIQNFKKCKNFINLNNLNKKFTLLRNIEHKKIFNFYKTHHLFVLPSIQEPASISVLEAIGYSMPVVCSDTNGAKSYLNNTFSKVYKSNNSLSLYKSIEYFLKNNQEYNKFSLKAYNSAYKNLSKKNYMKKFNAILKAEKIEYK